MQERGHNGTVKPEWIRAFNKCDHYMNASQRCSYQIQIKNGLLYQNDTIFDTGNMKTEFSGSGVAIFIQSVDGTFYSSNHRRGRLHFSNSTSEVTIRSAGEWKVENGRIVWISGKSRHYQPTMKQLINALHDLKVQNSLTHSIVKVVNDKNNAATDIDASFLVSNAHFFRVC
jgi:hypothetical protein